jgi:5-methylcytosine-specific restriction protein B
MLGLEEDDDLAEHQLTHYVAQDGNLLHDSTGLAAAVREKECGLWEIVQLHPSYSYEDFVRGLQATPTDDGEHISFEPINRIFGLLTAIAESLEEEDLPVILIVDEINRGDLSKVLGELIYALEYRNTEVLTPYPIEGQPALRIPGNLYLIGTMNTADRSIALVDYAIRRRFAFVTLRASAEIIEGYYGDRDLGSRAKALFRSVEMLFRGEGVTTGHDSDDVMVGHSYFLAKSGRELALKFAYEVVPLLREYQREGILSKLEIDLGDGQRLDLLKLPQVDIAQRLVGRLADSGTKGDR